MAALDGLEIFDLDVIVLDAPQQHSTNFRSVHGRRTEAALNDASEPLCNLQVEANLNVTCRRLPNEVFRCRLCPRLHFG